MKKTRTNENETHKEINEEEEWSIGCIDTPQLQYSYILPNNSRKNKKK